MRPHGIIRGSIKFCAALYFLIYFLKSTFQYFRNWEIRDREKFLLDAYLLKSIKSLSSYHELEFSLETFYIKRGRAFVIFYYLVSKLLG